MMQKRFSLLATIAIVALLSFSGCAAMENTGSLSLSVAPAVSIMTIGPPITMACVSYDVTIENGPTTVDPSTIGTASMTIAKLLPGDYDINVVGRNLAGDALGSGSTSVSILIGITNEASVTIDEYTDTPGSLHIDLTYEPLAIGTPIFYIDTKDFAGTVTPMVITNEDPVTGSGDADLTGMAVGWHSIVATLYDGAVQSSGFATLARIVNGRESSGAVHTFANAADGALDIIIDTDFFEDLELTADVAEGRFPMYPLETLDITLSSSESFLSVWYSNGVQVAIDQTTYTIDAESMQIDQTFRIDVICYSLDGRRAAALSWQIDKEDYSEAMMSISGYARNSIANGALGPIKVAVFEDDQTTHILTVFVIDGVVSGTMYPYNTGPLPYAGDFYAVRFVDFNENDLLDVGERPTWSELVSIPHDGTLVVTFSGTIE